MFRLSMDLYHHCLYLRHDGGYIGFLFVAVDSGINGIDRVPLRLEGINFRFRNEGFIFFSFLMGLGAFEDGFEQFGQTDGHQFQAVTHLTVGLLPFFENRNHALA